MSASFSQELMELQSIDGVEEEEKEKMRDPHQRPGVSLARADQDNVTTEILLYLLKRSSFSRKTCLSQVFLYMLRCVVFAYKIRKEAESKRLRAWTKIESKFGSLFTVDVKGSGSALFLEQLGLEPWLR